MHTIANNIQGTINNNCQTRLWAHEVTRRFEDVDIGQTVLVTSGPFCGMQFVVQGKLSNRFDKFYFVTPAEQFEPASMAQ